MRLPDMAGQQRATELLLLLLLLPQAQRLAASMRHAAI
jgi:hypothetical protein